MEILTETALWGQHIFAIILWTGITLFVVLIFIAIIFPMITERIVDVSGIIGSIISLTLSVLFTLTLFVGIKNGPTVEYTAIVTDYNEVYEQGYEIVRHEGKLVILTKEGR